MKKKMLVIPGPFVPYNDTLTLLNYKRLAHLDLEFDVLAIGGKTDPSIKKELDNDNNFNKFNITKVLDYKKMDIVHNPFNIFYFLFAFLIYKKEALKLAKNSNYDYLYTASHPGMVHLIGKSIKKRNKDLKWFASFSDPIKGSPYKTNPEINKRNTFYRIAFNIGTFFYVGDFYEKAAIEHADNLIFICNEQRDFTCNQYLNPNQLIQKSIILPLTIEPKWDMYKDLLNYNHSQNKPLIATHLGRIYGLRKIDTFIDAIFDLKEEGIIDNSTIQFHQYDEIEPQFVKLVKDKYLEDIFVIHNKVAYKESIEIMRNSDILLLFDTIMSGEKIQPYLPSKISEYLVLRKNILAVCESNSPSFRILKDYGHLYVGYDKEAIKNNIVSLINKNQTLDYSITELFAANNKNILEKYL